MRAYEFEQKRIKSIESFIFDKIKPQHYSIPLLKLGNYSFNQGLFLPAHKKVIKMSN